MTEMTPTTIKLPDWGKPLFDKDIHTYYFYGGRYGAKTELLIYYILIRMLTEPLSVFCTREFQKSIEDSIHDQFRTKINELGWDKWFNWKAYEITTPIGGRIFYGGLWNTRGKVRSKNPPDITLVEEAAYVSRESIEELEPTIDRKPGSKLVYLFNTLSPNTPVYEDACTAEKYNLPGIHVKKINWCDHRFLPDQPLRRVIREKLLKPERYAHKYMGEPMSMTEGLVFHKDKHWRIGDLDDKVKHLEPHYAIDWGKTTNATVLGKTYYFDNTIYVHSCIHEYGLRTHEIPAFLAGTDNVGTLQRKQRWKNPRPGEWLGLLDPAEVSSVRIWCDWDTPNINEIWDAGFERAEKVPYKNKKDSEWQSVEWAKSKDIVVHPTRCPLLMEELPLYSYLPKAGIPGEYDWKKFVAGNDNAVDACLRYPFFHFIFEEDNSDGLFFSV